VRIAEPLGDYHRMGTTMSVLALVHGAAGEVDAGLQLMEPVVRLVQGAGNEVFVPGMAGVLGTLHLWRGELDEAVRWLEPESRATDRGADTYLAAQALPPLGTAHRHLARDEEASGVLDRGVSVARTLGMPAALAAQNDRSDHAVRVLAATDAARAAMGHHRRPVDQRAHEAIVTDLRTKLAVANRTELAALAAAHLGR
jgi:ATP/maltotriose-dependent transcriptional regulator MalT